MNRINSVFYHCECFLLQRCQTFHLFSEHTEWNNVYLLTIFFLHIGWLVFSLFHQRTTQHYLVVFVLSSCLFVIFFSEIWVVTVLKSFCSFWFSFTLIWVFLLSCRCWYNPQYFGLSCISLVSVSSKPCMVISI